ncbi:hypothetical protein LTR29_008729 [Friedmanniomyces endolithicus]|nr:hypothetical protein LTR29_008729 [Friedmanniomyces endolithicus]
MYAAEDPVEGTGEKDGSALMLGGSEGEKRSGPGGEREHATPVPKASPTATQYEEPEHELADPSTFEVNSGQTTPTSDESGPAIPAITAQAPATSGDVISKRSGTAERTDDAAITSPTPTTISNEHFDTPSKRNRPALSESPYSWMLGQDKTGEPAALSASASRGKTTAAQSTKTPEKAKVSAGLFGDGDGGGDGDSDVITVVHSGRRKRSGKQRAVVERLDGDHGALAADRAIGAT